MDDPNLPGGALNAAFARIHAASRAEPYPSWDLRRDRLRRLDALVRRHEKRIIDAIDADFGHRPAAETQTLELLPVREALRHALRRGAGWMRPRRAAVSMLFWPARARLWPQPLGVVGIVAPWNYPLHLSALPLVSAFAAGNRAMLKLSEYSPQFGTCFAELARAAFDADELAVFHGDARQAAAFGALAFDHLLFTGSGAVGRRVMAAAAAQLVPVTLELGGKSPAVLAPGYDLEHAALRIVHGKLLNAGQTCVAPDYVLLPRAARDAFAAACSRAARQLHPQGLASADYCSIVDTRQYARQCALLDEARAAGVELRPLFDGAQRDDAQHRLAPVLCLDPPPALALMREEIFGPLLPVLSYDDVDEALARINAAERPLALYWFDDDRARIERVLRATHAGGVTLNDTLLHVAQDTLPFGGVGASGTGAYHGRFGFERLSHLKPVLTQPHLGLGALVRPPYGARFDALIALLRRLR